MLLHFGREVFHIAVFVGHDLRPRQQAAVDDTGMVEFIGEDDILAAVGSRAQHG